MQQTSGINFEKDAGGGSGTRIVKTFDSPCDQETG
jgi:hypothetical protein